MIGAPATEQGAVPGEPAGVDSCFWLSSRDRLFLYVFPASNYDSQASVTGATPLGGIGQKAVLENPNPQGGSSVVFLQGSKTYVLSVGNTTAVGALKTLAGQLASNVPR